jgi:hypothetical protein
MKKILIGLIVLALVVSVVSANIVSNTVTYSTKKTHLTITVTPQTTTTSNWDNETVQLLTAGQLTVFLTVTVTNTTTGATSMTPFPFFFNGTATQGKTTMGNAVIYTSPTFTIQGSSQKQMQPPPIEEFSDNMSSASDGTGYSTTVSASAVG